MTRSTQAGGGGGGGEHGMDFWWNPNKLWRVLKSQWAAPLPEWGDFFFLFLLLVSTRSKKKKKKSQVPDGRFLKPLFNIVVDRFKKF